MRYRTLILVMLAVAGFAVVAAFRSSESGIPPASAPVRVLTTEPLRVKLTPNPTATEISVALGDALRTRASTERDPTMRGYIEALGGNLDYLASLSEEARRRLGTDAGALAYQLLHVDVSSERVAIAAVTAELLPNRGYVGTSTAHEDGHALINDQIAMRCGPPLTKEALVGATNAGRLRQDILASLYDAGTEAHNIYHGEVNKTGRDFARAARRAVELATERRC